MPVCIFLGYNAGKMLMFDLFQLYRSSGVNKMDVFFRNTTEEAQHSQQNIIMCPFLRNINEPTNFSFSSSMAFPTPVSVQFINKLFMHLIAHHIVAKLSQYYLFLLIGGAPCT